tara:strand:- start:67 stop:1119 length:1053 start_codon:yes stop_codon:yes gene_type:complete
MIRINAGTWLLLLCAIPVVGAMAQAEPDHDDPGVSDYIRYVEDDSDGSSRLQTSITRFSLGDTTVDLVAVVHLADADYYRNLDAYLTRYEAVLYELVGGQYRAQAPEETSEAGGAGEIAGVRGLQSMAQSLLGLELQLEHINYEAPNFVHADVDWDQYEELMEARNQSFTTIFSRAMMMADAGQIGGISTDEESLSLMFGQLLGAITTGDSAGLKRTIAPFLSEAEGFITQLEGDDGTVLVSERNKVVMAKIAEVMGGDTTNVAVFYGAGHMPDLESRLLAAGFAKGETTWADAWLLPAATSGGNTVEGSAPASPADIMINLLQQNPEMMNVIKEVSEALEAIQNLQDEE